MQQRDLSPSQLDRFMDLKKQEFLQYIDSEKWVVDNHIISQDKVYKILDFDTLIMIKIVADMPDDKIPKLFELVQKPEIMQQISGFKIEEVNQIDHFTEIFHITADFVEIQSREAVICSKIYKERGNQIIMVRSSIDLDQIPLKIGTVRVDGLAGILTYPSIPYSKTHKVVLAIKLDLKISNELEQLIIQQITQKIASAFQQLKEIVINQL